MAQASIISITAAIAALNVITAKNDVGGAGVIKIFTGAAPASTKVADTGTLLATLTLSSTSFPTAVDSSSTGLAVATANTITSGTAGATGIAGYYRSYPNSPTTTNAVFQGGVGASGSGELFIINNTSITTGDTVSCTAWVVSLPDGSGVD